jgi:hypothetical protein
MQSLDGRQMLSFPVIVVLIVFILPLLVPHGGPESLVRAIDLGPHKSTCSNQSGLQVSRLEAVGRLPQTLEADDAIHTHSVYKSNDAGQHLDFQLRDQKWAVLNIDAHQARFVMSRRQRLEMAGQRSSS